MGNHATALYASAAAAERPEITWEDGVLEPLLTDRFLQQRQLPASRRPTGQQEGNIPERIRTSNLRLRRPRPTTEECEAKSLMREQLTPDQRTDQARLRFLYFIGVTFVFNGFSDKIVGHWLVNEGVQGRLP